MPTSSNSTVPAKKSVKIEGKRKRKDLLVHNAGKCDIPFPHNLSFGFMVLFVEPKGVIIKQEKGGA